MPSFKSTMKAEGLHVLLVLAIGLLSLPLTAGLSTVRLVNGPTSCAGRVEVLHNGLWGSVCDDGWTMLNTQVVCNTIGCGIAQMARTRAFYGEGKDGIWLDDVRCTGSETSLTECSHREFGHNNCGHGEDVGVVCSDEVKLLNGSKRCEGRVEVKHGSQWMKVCSGHWSEKEHDVLCQQVSCGTALVGQDMPDFGQSGTPVGVSVSCLGNETSLMQCVLKEMAESCQSASLVCTYSKQIRLVNGTTPCSGRVEVLNDGQWGTICDDGWGIQEAEVGCREMKCGTALGVKHHAYFGPGEGQVILDDLGCLGSEKSLLECSHTGLMVNDCSHFEDAGLLCSDKIKLVNGTRRCNGRLEINHQDKWVTICKSSHWGRKEEALVCQELGCGKPERKPDRPNFGTSTEQSAFTVSCPGAESSVAACSFQSHNTACEEVVISCTDESEIRLVNGTDRCSGRVEILHDGQWGTVCDDHWDLKDAQVVCKAMDCGSPLAVKSGAYYGNGQGNIWLDDLMCQGNETSLKRCNNAQLGPMFSEVNCGHSEDAGVQCSSTIRLLNGSDHCSGRVEITHGDHWAPVYDTHWGLNEALVMCREMNCGEPVIGAAAAAAILGQASQVSGFTAICNGKEASISQCALAGYAPTSRDKVATLVCSGNVKLVNGSNKCNGRVEVYQSGEWGTLCDESWDMSDANVVCLSLQCGAAHKIPQRGFFGLGSNSVLVTKVGCNGGEPSLNDCPMARGGPSACNSTTVAGVLCSEGLPTRLVHPSGQCFGRVEVQHEGQWGTVCGHDWSMSDAQVVCDALGCGSALSISGSAAYQEGSGPIWEASDLCFANEESLFACSVSGFNGTDCSHEQDASVICTESIRLVNGMSQCSGRLEIYHNGQWGTVCDDEWEIGNSQVVCRQLGCGEGLSFSGASQFGAGSGPIWLDNVICTGEEDAITQCSHPDYGENNCGHSEDVGIMCLGNMPKPHITINPGTEVNFGQKTEITCSVLSDHIGGTYVLQRTPGPFQMTRYSESDSVTFTIPKANLSHVGSYTCHFQKRIQSKTIDMLGDSLELKVTVKLQQPIISLQSLGAIVIIPVQKIEVKGGDHLTISCSIFSSYDGGVFYLRRSNTTATKPQASQSHSFIQVAYFEIQEVSEKDQGDYACVYTLNVSTSTYSSVPSKTLRVVVSGYAVSSTVTGTIVGLVLVLALSTVVFLCWRRRGMASRAMVQFTSRVGEVIKDDSAEIRAGSQSERDYNTLANEYGNGSSPEDKGTNEVESQNTLEKNASEDLTGRVCYELEPLINP